jgi:hypothetical protein
LDGEMEREGPRWLPGAFPIRDYVFDLGGGVGDHVPVWKVQKLRGLIIAWATEGRTRRSRCGVISEVGGSAASTIGRGHTLTSRRIRVVIGDMRAVVLPVADVRACSVFGWVFRGVS